MTEVMRPDVSAAPSLPWPGTDGDPRKRPNWVAMNDTSLDLMAREDDPADDDLLPVRDDPISAVLRETSLDPHSVRDEPETGATDAPRDPVPGRHRLPSALRETSHDLLAAPDEPEIEATETPRDPVSGRRQLASALRETSLDLLAAPGEPATGITDAPPDHSPMRDEPAVSPTETPLDLPVAPDEPEVSQSETSFELPVVRGEHAASTARASLEPVPVRNEPVISLTDAWLDQMPVRDDAGRDESARDIGDTSFDLAPVRDVPAGDGGRADRYGPASAQGAGTRATRAPEAPRRRPAHPGGGTHPGRAASRPRQAPEPPFPPSRSSAPQRLAVPRRLAAPPRPAGASRAWRPVAAGASAGAVLAATVPLCLLQLQYAPLPPFVAGATAAPAGGSAEVLRTASLALPLAVSAAPLAALAVRRLRAWPVLLAGLLIMTAGGLLDGLYGTGAGSSGGLAATVGALRGIGAGLMLPATVAVVTEYKGRPRRLLAAWWAAVAAAALAVLPALGAQHATGWRAALGPLPWLTVAALTAALLYPALAERPRLVRGNREPAGAVGRIVRPPAEHTRLPLLAPAAAALGVIAVAVTYHPSGTIGWAALFAAAGLLVMAAIDGYIGRHGGPSPRRHGAVHRAAGSGFGVACAVTGFFLAPASGALAGLRAMASAGAPAGTVAPGVLLAVAAAIGAVAGAGTALIGGDARARYRALLPGISGMFPRAPAPASPTPVFGLLLAAAALVAASFAGPFAGWAVLMVLVAVLTGGLAAAIARPAAEVTATGAMAGVIILAAGTLAGYLAAGALRVMLAGIGLAGPVASAAVGSSGHLNRIGVITAGSSGPVTGPDAVPHALVTAAGWWELAAATVAVLVVFAWYAGRARELAPFRWQPRHVRRATRGTKDASDTKAKDSRGTKAKDARRDLRGTTGWGADEGTGDGTDEDTFPALRARFKPPRPPASSHTGGHPGGHPNGHTSGHAAGDRGDARVNHAHR